MRSTLQTFTCLFVGLLCLPASAAITYRIEIANGTGPNKDTRASSVGDSITANVILDLTGTPPTLTNYGVSFGFDFNELQYVSGVETPPTPLQSFNALTFSNVTGQVGGIEAGTLGATGAAAGSYTIASFTFNVLNPVGDVTDFDLVLSEGILDGSFFSDFSQQTPVFGNASIIAATAVPEPSSFVVLGFLSCVGLGGLRKRRSARRKAS